VRLARLLNARDVVVEALTDATARAAGVLCGTAGTTDVIDASVVLTARRHNAAVISSDRADLEALDPTVLSWTADPQPGSKGPPNALREHLGPSLAPGTRKDQVVFLM
jgi:hypothetical protein